MTDLIMTLMMFGFGWCVGLAYAWNKGITRPTITVNVDWKSLIEGGFNTEKIVFQLTPTDKKTINTGSLH